MGDARFFEAIREDGSPVSVRIDAVQSIRRDDRKHGTVVEFGDGRYEVLRTKYEDVAKMLRHAEPSS